MNNLSQLGKASVQYMADAGGMFTSSSTGGETWPRVMEGKYIAGWNVFRSPFDRVTDSRPLAGSDGNAKVPISYGINANLFDRSPDEWADVMEHVIFAAPAVAKLPGSAIRWQDDAFSDQNCRIFAGGGGSAFGTHLDRSFINVLFADFHVERVKCEDFSDDKSAKGKVRWTGAVERP
jgi:prepilin-type processing-associated H-X9-DG protein